MADEKLYIDIETRNKALNDLKATEKAVRDNEKAIKGMILANQQADPSFKTLVNSQKQLKAQLDNTKASMKEFGLGSKVSGFQLLEFGENLTIVVAGLTMLGKKLYDVSLQSARFQVLRENFKGTEEDLEAFRIATAKTVTDANLIKLSNQATDLGVGLREQAILFSLAEDAADKYGTSVEEGFQKVIYATEGNVKGLKSIGIQKEVYEEIVKRLAKAHGEEIDKLDAETQKQIRLQAVIEASGVTYDMAVNKVQDIADKHERLTTVIGNLVDKYGGDFVDFLLRSSNIFGVLYTSIEKVTDIIPQAVSELKNFQSATLDLAGNIPVLNDALKTITDTFFDIIGASNDAQDAISNFTKTTPINASQWNPIGANYDVPIDTRNAPLLRQRDIQAKRRSENEKNKKDKKEELNLLTIEQEKLDKLNKQLSANTGLIGAELELKKQIKEVEERILFLKLGQIEAELRAITLTKQPLAKLAGNLPTAKEGKFGESAKSSTEELKKSAVPIEEAFNSALSVASQVSALFGEGASKVVAGFQQAFSIANSIIGLISTIMSIASGGIGLPFMARGGKVQAGKPYVVGEQGMELFVPSSSGTIIPNSQINNYGGGDTNVNLYGTLSGQTFLRKEMPRYNNRVSRVSI